MTHIAYYINSLTDIDENTGKSMNQLIAEDGFSHGTDNEAHEYIARPLAQSETVESAPDIVVNSNPIPKTGYTPPSVPTLPI